MMDINKRIIQLREEKGYSTTKLAKLAGIAQSTLREIELGNTSPTWDTINKLCKALEISPLALLSEFYPNAQEQELLLPEVNRIMEKIKRMSLRQLRILDIVLDEWKIEEQKKLNPIQSMSKEEELQKHLQSEIYRRQPRATKDDMQRSLEDFEKRLQEINIEPRTLRKF